MGFLRNIQSLFRGGAKGQDGGVYLYVKVHKVPNRPSPEDEIVQLRLNPYSDVSEDDDGNFFAKKTVVGPRSFRRAEITVFFDNKRNIRGHEVSGGEVTTEEDFNRYQMTLK
ncbi:MAG: hypothetical protein HY862_07540 [Chloroflexi bacterium]|nr:hypothetical protein [Chloroflexota bacterium]